MEVDDFADRIRSMIEHENTLENNRLNWLLITQGLLFAAVGVALESNVRPLFIYICSAAGLVTSLSAGIHLRHGRRAMNDLLKKFKERIPDYGGPRVIGLDMQKDVSPVKRYLIPPYFLPWVFIVLWVVIFLSAKCLVQTSP